MDATDLLNQIQIPNPCPVAWSDMTGDERVRFCRQCGRHVYHLAQFTVEDGARLLTTRGDDLCLQVARRQDGTVVTADAVTSVSAPRRWRSRFARGLRLLGAMWAGLLLVTGCQGSASQRQGQTPFWWWLKDDPLPRYTQTAGKVYCPLPPSAPSSPAMVPPSDASSSAP